jgi:hypothetical protein
MLRSLSDLSQYPLIFILYPAGTSGEFLAHALSQCVPEIFQAPAAWEGQHRMKFTDCLGRRLAVGATDVDESDVIDQFNYFLEHFGPVADRHLVATAHPDDSSTRWIQQHCAQCPVIEITTAQYASQRFRDLAATEKIGPKERDCYNYHTSGKIFRRHLKVEWLDLCLKDTRRCFHEICGFIDLPGQNDLFCALMQDYRQRNQHLIDIICANTTSLHSR